MPKIKKNKSTKKSKRLTKKFKTTSSSGFSLFNKKLLAAIVILAACGYFALNSFAAITIIPVKPNSRFAWLLQGTPDESIMDSETGPKVYDFDYLNSDAAQVSRIKAKGITVICYFSAGTDEDWRPDHSQFKVGDTFGQLPGWDGELIVDTRSANVRSIMYNRIQAMSNIGCDGIEPDNIDAYTNSSSIPLNETTTLDYMQFLTDTAHSFKMSVALKNGGDLINKKLPNGKTVLQAHDFAVVEQCYQYKECDTYQSFIAANKAVFIIEYKGAANTWATSASCKDANSKNYDAYLMNLNLNGPRTPCRTSGDVAPTVEAPANQPPTINITSPVNKQQFATGSSITFSADASDVDGSIKQVEFFKGTTSLSIDKNSPYTTIIDGLVEGSYSLRAVVTDNSNSSNGTATMLVTINVVSPVVLPTANILPVINLQTPPSTISAPASLVLSAGATDSDGSISRVEFYSGSAKIGEDISSPYTLRVDNYLAGTYIFTAKAVDNTGASTISNSVKVIVTTAVSNTPDTTNTPNTISAVGAPVWPSNATMKSGFHSSWWSNNCAFETKCKVYVWWPDAKDDKKVTGYEVWRSVDNKDSVKLYVNDSDDQYYTEKLSKDSIYNYRIFAVDRDGNRTAGPSKSVKINCILSVCSL